MANANAIVEQLKELGLRHGEKAGVAIASMVFLVCVGMAATQKSIDTSPDQVKKAAELSQSNLTRTEKREIIIDKLAEKGIKDSDFAKVVDEQVKTALVSDNYKAAREWVTPEPGAGLIRDQPTLITVTELYAYPGRGGILVFDLDENGNRIPDKDAGKEAAPGTRRRRRRPAGALGGITGGGAPKKKGKSRAEIEREDKEDRLRKERQLQNKFSGGNAAEETKTNDEKEAPAENFKEVTKGYRWVVITGVLDHAKLVANYRQALKNPAVAHPNYKRLDLQRQALQADGIWTKWENVSSDENLKVLDNLPEVDDDELTPETVRPKSLVDPLPFLKAGLWEKVHIGSLVPKEKKAIPKTETMPGGMMGGRMGGYGGMMMSGGGSGPTTGMMGGGGGMRSRGMSGMAGMMMGGGGGMMGGGMFGGTESAGDFWRSEEKNVMIRAFDFTAHEDTTYRYRVRIVVFNPNKGRDDISPGVDNKSDELRGDWSESTDQVTMPPDVMPYVLATTPPGQANDMKVTLQVIRFHPADGVTVPRSFDAAPGEVIGEPRTSDIPVSDGTGKKSKVIDFNSRQIMLDVFAIKKTGGFQHLPAGFVGPPIARAALALLLRPDGSVAVHNEVDDESNEVRKDVYANYRHEIDQSGKKRESSRGMGYMGGMMGGMMGRMGGGGMGGR
jgi:hypothetical protein